MGKKADPSTTAANVLANRGLVARVLGGVPVPQPEPLQEGPEGPEEAARPAPAAPAAPVRQRQKAPPAPAPVMIRTVSTSHQLRPDQVAALRELAVKRCNARGWGKPDSSELVREAVDAWLAQQE